MPRYTYRCEKCEFTLETVHSMKECLTDCDQCDEKSTLVRVPAITFIKAGTAMSAPTGQKVGELVEQHIHDAREELAQEKADLRGKDYKEKK
mgnify:CR=1 FL=1